VSKHCLIIGCGSHCHSVISVIETLPDFNIIGLVDTRSLFDNSEIKSGYQVVNSLENILKNSVKFKNCHFAIAVGDNKERANIYNALNDKGLATPNFISEHAFIDRTVKMGDGNIIFHNVVVNAHTIIGNNNQINTAAIIEHDAIMGNHNHMAPMSLICGSCKLADFCFIGAGACVLPGKRVENNTIVGAGGVLVSSATKENTTFVGIPARVK